jgi:hypothetical protein
MVADGMVATKPIFTATIPIATPKREFNSYFATLSEDKSSTNYKQKVY